MPRFDDCESCAFFQVEEAVCDECQDGDQWENCEPSDLLKATTQKPIQWKKAA